MGARAIHPIVVAVLVAGLGGCAASGPTFGIVADSYCVAAKKITWSPEDTRPTIDQIVRHNQGYDRACGVKGRKTTPTS